uniref:Lipase domain-containing protein n=1 Tax=Stomoxys calcitrans TaxID=35570 RepID=A0A1I8PD64_STOCA
MFNLSLGQLILVSLLCLCEIYGESEFEFRNDMPESYHHHHRSNINNNNNNNNVINLYSVRWLHLPSTVRNLSNAMRRTTSQSKPTIQKSIEFIFYKNGDILFRTTPGNVDLQKSLSFLSNQCGGNEKTAYVFHGWTESCTTEWVTQLIERLTFYRGGCIICVDYKEWADKPYLDLVQRFDVISEILYEEILTQIRNGLNPQNNYMFGFSYGGQLASKIGRVLNFYHGYKIKRMDLCDIAGPGFDFLSYSRHHEAADNVSCYYSSLDKSTQFRNCDQNILLGHCGYTQPAVLSQPYWSSHGLSVRMYINAFDFPFYASKVVPPLCISGNPIKNIPEGFKVGYNGDLANGIAGDIFVPTSLNYPYNLSKRELKVYEKYLNSS